MEQPKDTTAKAFFSQKTIVADFCNAFLYDGERVVKPEDLKEWPTEQIGLPKRLRDLLYLYTACTDGETTYLFLGMEFQSSPDRTMLFRTMEYDARQYCQQFSEENNLAEPLRPVITFVLNLSNRPWNYPTTLHETFANIDPRLHRFLPNYHINLIDCQKLSKKQRNRLVTELRAVFGCFAHANEKRDILKELAHDVPGGRLSTKAVNLLNAHLDLNIPIHIEGKKETSDMCIAIRYLRQNLIEKGEKRGERKGEKRGEKKGRKEGIRKALDEVILKGLQKNVPMEILQQLTGFSPRKIRAIQRQLT